MPGTKLPCSSLCQYVAHKPSNNYFHAHAILARLASFQIVIDFSSSNHLPVMNKSCHAIDFLSSSVQFMMCLQTTVGGKLIVVLG